MPPRVRVICQHHPRRELLLPRLADAVRPYKLCVIADPDPTGPAAPWRTYRLCLEEPGDHLVILQDDAQPCRGFASAVRQIIRAKPDNVVCLYHGRYPHHSYLQLLRAAERCERYAEVTPMQWLPLVGTIWPAKLAEQAAREIGDPTLGYADDGLIARWMRRRHLTALVTIPNLVQHDDTQRTLMRPLHVSSNRSAACWIGSDTAASYDWS